MPLRGTDFESELCNSVLLQKQIFLVGGAASAAWTIGINRRHRRDRDHSPGADFAPGHCPAYRHRRRGGRCCLGPVVNGLATAAD